MSEKDCDTCLYYEETADGATYCVVERCGENYSGWRPKHQSISFIDKLNDALPKEKKFSLDKLIDDHWRYINNLLEAHSQEPEVIEIAEFHYRTAFQYGFGHGVEKCSKGDVEWDDQESRWKGRNTENGQS